MSDKEEVTDGAVNDGYGLSRSSGESMKDDSSDAAIPDQEPAEKSQTDSRPDGTRGVSTDSSAAEDRRQHSTSSTPTEAAKTSQNDSELRPFDWGEHGQAVKDAASTKQIDHRPTVRLDNGYHYILGRSSVIDGLTNTGARVRPELKNDIETAINDANRTFDEEDVKKSDYFEAALTVALWNHDEVLAVLAELGYGVRG